MKPSSEETFETASGLKIFLRSWRPAGTAARGRGDRPRLQLSRRPIRLGRRAASSPRASPSTRSTCAAAAVPRASASTSTASTSIVADVDEMMAIARSRNPGLPVFLLGHSAGGVISCMYALDHQDDLAGLICESFAFQVPAPDFALAVLKGLSHFAPHAHVLKLKIEDFSRDPAVVAADERRPADRGRGAADPDRRRDGPRRRAAQARLSALPAAAPDHPRHRRQGHPPRRQPALLRRWPAPRTRR